ncbi:MBL fold metallo-hydrolase [Olivibacter sp. 47]|uniref:MBL fold metallo-hydrolase n=1 Tax=Olivibacter sp. 47 TaxID=3056486 RepID=UPI0025A3CFE7|nr:MBL fold metallo-hydrolase [Olivibacter sp. 47]MDM8174762.1 MBL fold metallo-hydrolase [Olivibacter sp. 47]
MRLHVINSNSEGNCYLFTDSQGYTLIVECGVRFNLIKEALGFDLARVVGCIVTHEHGDHSKGVLDATKSGIDVFATAGTIKGFGFKSHRFNYLKIGAAIKIGSFEVLAFDTRHDTIEPCGFLIRHPEMGTTLFLTDTVYCEYQFPGLTNILIEANHSQKILNERLEMGYEPKFLRDRVIKSHMSLETTIKTLLSYDMTKVNNIVLIHLSDRNSHAIEFQKEIELATAKTVTVASKGLTIENFNVTPF